MLDRAKEFTVAEYFAGIGLVRMGLEQNGWTIIWANDFSNKKYEIYKDFFPNSNDHYSFDDIFKIDPNEVPTTFLATCSFPCVNLSVAGNMEGINGKQSSAFWGFIKILEEQKKQNRLPKLMLLENVPGWIYSNEGQDFRLTVEAINKLGYSCDVFTLDACRFTPQSRLRVFLVCKYKEQNDYGLHLILNRKNSLLPKRLRESLIKNKDLNWFYNEIPEPPKKEKPVCQKLLKNLMKTILDGGLPIRWITTYR